MKLNLQNVNFVRARAGVIQLTPKNRLLSALIGGVLEIVWVAFPELCQRVDNQGIEIESFVDGSFRSCVRARSGTPGVPNFHFPPEKEKSVPAKVFFPFD